ncbi:hypothetical protein [Lactococcus lactis]|nr:hypothetical protein [Lactococcus lactis]MDT2867114.1 hypothetical protein [Lactococcus lactis]
MTIVAKNSLTISNVNDGTITHYAYAYSADGTDRFTTTYPNLNLVSDTNFDDKTNRDNVWINYMGTTVTGKGNNNGFLMAPTGQTAGAYQDSLLGNLYSPTNGKINILKPSTIYTLSFYAKGTISGTDNFFRHYIYPSTVDTSYHGMANGNTITNASDGSYNRAITSDWTFYTYTFKTLSTYATTQQQFLFRIQNLTTVTVSQVKIEEGTVATPWMPSASEVTTADWPSYIGQYSDFNTTASTDPAKYAPWIIFKGNDGNTGKSVWSFPYDRGANGVRRWWSDLKPTPTTDNPPKVGDTIIDLVGNIYQITNVVVGTAQQGGGTFDYGPMLTSIKGANGKDGIAGKDGVGIKTSVITYAISTSGTTAPTSGWTSSVPSLVKGQYLWTKTVWTYTDNSSETGYSVTYISKDGNNGKDGIAGKDGVGIKTTTITYVGSTSGTTVPTTGWTSSVPTVPAGQFLWTKTVWRYSDNTSETGYSVAKMGNTGATGPAGPPGSTGAPGKVVSNTEPISLFKGLTWKYSGTAKLTASDGTVIHPNTEYYYNGTHWMINYLSANNLEANSITADLIDAKNLTITDGEFVSTIIDGSVKTQTEIKDDHLLIYKMDTSTNSINTIALKSDSGLAMTYQNSDTGKYTSAGVNFQGLFMQNNITNEFARLTPRGTDLSTDVPWTNLTLASGFSIGSGGKARYRVKNGVLYIHFRKIVCPALSRNQPNTLCYVPAKGRASDGYDSIGVMSATNSTRIQYNDSGDGKVAIVPASNTTAGQGFNGFLICPMD